MSAKDAEEMLATFRVSKHLIPKIFAKDAALAGMGAKPGKAGFRQSQQSLGSIYKVFLQND